VTLVPGASRCDAPRSGGLVGVGLLNEGNTVNNFTIAAVSIIAASGVAYAQSASATLSAMSTDVAPGATISLTLTSDYDTGGASSGIFGTPGFYGFGGNLIASGDAAAAVSASAPLVNAALSSGSVSSAGVSPQIARAGAGRGLLGGIGDMPATLLTVDVTIDAGASAGDTVTIDFDGAVVLNLGGSLVTFSTDPGLNQQTLATNSVTLTIAGGGCNPADLAEPFGQLTFGDISAFLAAFSTQDPAADLASPFGQFTFGDISAFLGAFSAGCP
jgi:hypothetical protein